jgi:hypothetical protein
VAELVLWPKPPVPVHSDTSPKIKNHKSTEIKIKRKITWTNTNRKQKISNTIPEKGGERNSCVPPKGYQFLLLYIDIVAPIVKIK